MLFVENTALLYSKITHVDLKKNPEYAHCCLYKRLHAVFTITLPIHYKWQTKSTHDIPPWSMNTFYTCWVVSRVHLHPYLFLLTANEFVLILNIQGRNHQYICRQLPATPNEQQVDGKLSFVWLIHPQHLMTNNLMGNYHLCE